MQERRNVRNYQVKILSLAGILMRLFYIYYTNYTTRQHDVWKLGGGDGHLGYMEFFLNHPWSLPEINIQAITQFYQPPLHYILAAGFVRINVWMGVGYEQAFENVQFLTFFYSIALMVVCYRILVEVGLKDRPFLYSYAIICFHPTLLILSGSINNDLLALLFTSLAILSIIRWYKNPKDANMIKAGLMVALANLSKGSALLIIPAFLFLGCYKVWKENDKLWIYVRQAFTFAGLTLIGMSWMIWNYIRYQMPFDFVPHPPADSGMSTASYSFVQRIFDVGGPKFLSVYENLREPNMDYNIPLAICKNSMFGEFVLTSEKDFLYYASWVLLAANIILCILAFGLMWYLLFRKSNSAFGIIKHFLVIYYITVMVLYLKFCFEYPETCTMDYRYIPVTMIIGSIFIGKGLEYFESHNQHRNQIYGILIRGIIKLFCVSSFAVYNWGRFSV